MLPELDERLSRLDAEANNLGLTTEKSIAYWSRLNFCTRDAASANESLKRRISELPRGHAAAVFIRSMPRLIAEYEVEKGSERDHARFV